MQYKFRGKRIDNKEWVYGNFLLRHDSLGALSLIEVQDKETFEIEVHQVYPESVGMYSGWNDIKGNPIFEDDILRGVMHEQGRDICHERTEQVISDRGGLIVFGKPMQNGRGTGKNILKCFKWFDSGSNGMRDQYWQIDTIEIIGNIHNVNPTSGQSVDNYMLHDPNVKAAESNEQATEQESAAQDAATGASESAEEGSTEG